MIIDSQFSSKSPRKRVCAVIVTYNRLALLKQALAAVRQQSRKADTIIIVDNGSTDGTGEWLAGEADSEVQIVTQANLGGAGGFHAGMLAGFQAGADWAWCMDDDTIPDRQCLKQLLVAEERHLAGPEGTPPGWICSVVRWSDGSLHRMNEPKVESFLRWGADVVQRGIVPARWCSFVSVAISRQALVDCGLPLKDMFIWYDDVEFTARITGAGFAGLVALESQVEHRTATNYAPDVEGLDATNLWRFRYAFRNEVVVLKTLCRQQPRKLALQFCKMMLRRVLLMLRAGKLRFVPLAIGRGIAGLMFPMRIDSPQLLETKAVAQVPEAAPSSIPTASLASSTPS